MEGISLQEAEAAMMKLAWRDDPEYAHVKADEILCAFLIGLGYHELVKRYQAIEKWYA